MPAKGQFGPLSVKNGKKRCRGPLHNGEWLAINKFLLRKRKNHHDAYYESRCKECVQFLRGFDHHYSGIVSLKVAWPVFTELVRRLGITESARRAGIEKSVFYRVAKKQGHYVRGKTFAKAIIVLVEARQKNEVRHKNDIHTGAYLRGRPERKPIHHTDFYSQASDAENEKQRRKRMRAVT